MRRAHGGERAGKTTRASRPVGDVLLEGVPGIRVAPHRRLSGAVLLERLLRDSTGDAMENQTLSEARARAVGDALTAQGIASSRLVVQAFGTGSPASGNATAEGRRRNRRVEVTVR